MFQKRMQRAAVALIAAALLAAAPLQAAGWTTREAPGLLELAWGWLMEWATGTGTGDGSLSLVAEADEAPASPGGQRPGEPPSDLEGDDGGAIDPDG